MKCSCNIAPQVRNGKAVQEDGKTWWRQIFYCNNPACPHHGKDIGERKINVLDETEIIEESYI